jgi:hypothetical protein
VDDWESVTKNLTLVPLPSPHPVNEILTLYFDEEKTKRVPGSAEADLLEEVIVGMKDYFEKCLGRILLYRFERQQYYDARDLWVEGKGEEWEGKKNAGDVYGAEHFCRLLGKFKKSCIFFLGKVVTSASLCLPPFSISTIHPLILSTNPLPLEKHPT